MEIQAVDYDLGPPGIAYADRVDANYHVDTGKERTEWNDGRTYRNDGVDIARDPDGMPYVTAFEAGEWMQYTLDVAEAGSRGVTLTIASDAAARLAISVNDGPAVSGEIQAGSGWRTISAPPLVLQRGTNRVRVAVISGTVKLKTIRVL